MSCFRFFLLDLLIAKQKSPQWLFRKLSDNSLALVSPIRVYTCNNTIFINVLIAALKQNLGSSLWKNVVSMGFIEVVNHWHSLSIRTKRSNIDTLHFLSDFIIVVAPFIDHFKKCTLSLVADLFKFSLFFDGMSIWIQRYSVAQNRFDTVRERFIFLIKFFKKLLESPQFSHSHLIFCQSSSLVTTNIVSSSHSLAGR